MAIETISTTLEEMEQNVVQFTKDLFKATAAGREYQFEKGIYRYLPLMPTKALKSALSIEREILTLITSFDDLQARTITVIKNLLRANSDRYEKSIMLVVHSDKRGGSKLKNWGRENGYTILSIYYRDILDGENAKDLLNNELFNQDPFDITGPVSSESEFFGRRDEAISFSRKIQRGSINSVLGLRKTGKTSIINRVTAECNDKYADFILFIDCSRDEVWSLDSNKLLKTIYANIKDAKQNEVFYQSLVSTREFSPISIESIVSAIDLSDKQVILIFDEFDYITPSSPTNQNIWSEQFNQFWRQMRVVYQEICRRKRNLSIVLCGVTSKWFSVTEINGIENAAVSLVPEEYLRPLQENAVMAMVKALGNRCGLSFDKKALETIYNGTSGIPSWIRKFCSYINRKVPIENRPTEVTGDFVNQLLNDYTFGEGISYSKVAIDHLFTVYPEVRISVSKFIDDPSKLSPNERLLLNSYGISNAKNGFTGKVMKETIDFCLASTRADMETLAIAVATETSEWADEIAELAKRQNIIEKTLRKIVIEMLRSDSRQNQDKGTSKDRILKCLEDKRKKELASLTVDMLIEKTFWLELISVLKKEWTVFGVAFGDQGLLVRHMELLNDRPYAHAKKIEPLELVVSKSALKYLEELIVKYENV